MTGRTTAEVLRDPQHAEDVREANRHLELADQRGMSIEATLAHLDAAISAFKRIDARERQAVTKCGPRPRFPMGPVQIIQDTNRHFYVSFNGDNGHGPFRTRGAAQAYADRARRP